MFDNIVMSLIQYYFFDENSTWQLNESKGGSIVDILSKIRLAVALNIMLIWYLVIIFTLAIINLM